MDIRRLSLFARVYETGSLTEAARDEFVSRQAVSRAISQLEGELGPLFTRMPRGVGPTDLRARDLPVPNRRSRHARRSRARRSALPAALRGR